MIKKLIQLNLKHFYSTKSQLIHFKEFGNPKKVINVFEQVIQEPLKDQLQVKFLCAPINPSDLNQIQGVYPKRPTLNDTYGAVGGNEGVAKVVQVGDELKSKFDVGDWVIPNKSCLGTWRTVGNFDGNQLIKVPKVAGIDPPMVGMLSVNPSTAYRMLKDFTSLQPGDWVIQNGSNSAVGQSVIQLCRVWGLKSINIVRDRDGIENVKRQLEDLGATIVVTDKEFRSSEFQTRLRDMNASVKLGLNCVGGKLVNDMAKVLENKSPLVTYGGMSREPVTLATSNLIFKQINFTGYWMAEWSERASDVDRVTMWQELLQLMSSGKLELPRYDVIEWGEGGDEVLNKIRESLILGSGSKKLIQFE